MQSETCPRPRVHTLCRDLYPELVSWSYKGSQTRLLSVLRSSTAKVEQIQTSSAGSHQLARLVGLSPEGRNLPALVVVPPPHYKFPFACPIPALRKKKPSRLNPSSFPIAILPSLPRVFFDDIQPSPHLAKMDPRSRACYNCTFFVP